MKKLIKRPIVILPLFLMLGGCATLTSGPLKRVSVNSYPAGAHVTTQDGETRSTPCVLNFSGFQNQMLSIEKDGYEPASVLVTKRFQARFWWNVFFWPGAVLDLVTGSAWRLEPKAIDIALQRKQGE